MKNEEELKPIIEKIASDKSPVGMNAVYVHAVIIDKLNQIEKRLSQLERSLNASDSAPGID